MENFDDLAGKCLVPASGDASFRRYFRVHAGELGRIVMDAPPDKEDCGRFMRIATQLEAMGLNAPRVLAANRKQGFLLLTDLGSARYLELLEANPERADEFYGDAIRALVMLQRKGSQYQSSLPPYDDKLLSIELSLFREWLCNRHLAIDFTADELHRWNAVCDLLKVNALTQPLVFVHRDYHSRNLMFDADNNPGILDFQDAVEGPYTYDIVSLLKDCYIEWPPGKISNWALAFFRERRSDLDDSINEEVFVRQFELMGVQRQLKAAGIFARLKHRDGKSGYMKDIPRTLNYVMDTASRYDELAFLNVLIGTRVLPALQEQMS